jgi:hypothetical protein
MKTDKNSITRTNLSANFSFSNIIVIACEIL